MTLNLSSFRLRTPLTASCLAMTLAVACQGETSSTPSDDSGDGDGDDASEISQDSGMAGAGNPDDGNSGSLVTRGDGDGGDGDGDRVGGGELGDGDGGPTAAGGAGGAGPDETDPVVDPPAPCEPGSIVLEVEDSAVGSLPEYVDNNYDHSVAFHATKWTHGGRPHAWRSLIQFELPELHEDATVTELTLDLQATTYRNTYRDGGGHHPLTRSNASSIYAIVDEWSASTVTWNTQPGIAEGAVATLAESISWDQDYSVDLSEWAASVYEGETENHGLLMRLDNETHYASLYFNSSEVAPEDGQGPVVTLTYRCE